MLKRNRIGTNLALNGHVSFSGAKIRHHDGRVRFGRRHLLTELLAVIRSLSPPGRKKTSSKARCGLNSIVDGEKFEQSRARVMFGSKEKSELREVVIERAGGSEQEVTKNAEQSQLNASEAIGPGEITTMSPMPLEAGEHQLPLTARGIKQHSTRGKFHVLVVDDDPDKSEMLKFALAMEGYEVHIATNGREALSAIESFQPDLVVSDIMMPEIDGYELARRIRENPRTRYIPIILQSAARIEAQDFRLGEEVGALGFITDTSDLGLLLARSRTLLDFRAHLETCEEAAFTDHLTGAANRRRFDQQLEREIQRAERYGHPFCLLLLDIDDFKKINDTFGHETGDEVITRLAKILHDGIRSPDLVARIGGDEFAVLLVETNVVKGFEVADRLRQTIKASDFPATGSGTIKVTASFGIAELPPDERTTPELLARRADAALYEAKREGRDRVSQAQPLWRSRGSGY